MNSRKFSAQKWSGFLEASWPQMEDESCRWSQTSFHKTRLSYMCCIWGKWILTGLVTAFPTRLSTARTQWRKYVMAIGLLDSFFFFFFHISPVCNQLHTWLPHFRHIAFSEASQHHFSASLEHLVVTPQQQC